MLFAWEEMLTFIVDMDLAEEIQGFLHRWVDLASCKMYEEEIGMKKVLDSEITEREVQDILENSGYIVCYKCRKIVEDDHICLA